VHEKEKLVWQLTLCQHGADIGSCSRSHPRGPAGESVLEATGLYALDLPLLLSCTEQVQLWCPIRGPVRTFCAKP